MMVGSILINYFYFIHYGGEYKGITTFLMMLASFTINASASVFISSSYFKNTSYYLLDSDSGEDVIEEGYTKDKVKACITFGVL